MGAIWETSGKHVGSIQEAQVAMGGANAHWEASGRQLEGIWKLKDILRHDVVSPRSGTQKVAAYFN